PCTMDTKNHDESVSALATQRDKSDIIMDDPNNTEPQGSTVSIHNTSSSSCSCSTVLYAINDKMRAMATNPPSTTTNVEEKDSNEFRLPPESRATFESLHGLSCSTNLVGKPWAVNDSTVRSAVVTSNSRFGNDPREVLLLQEEEEELDNTVRVVSHRYPITISSTTPTPSSQQQYPL
ncbi:hypothetical protein BGZ88_010196, partial [Linnemannia elongata]